MEISDDREYQYYIGKAVRAEASEQRMSMAALARGAGMNIKVLNRALDCQRPLRMEQLTMIARTLRRPLSYLMSEAERKHDLATPVEHAKMLIDLEDALNENQKLTQTSVIDDLLSPLVSGDEDRSGEKPTGTTSQE